MLTESRSLRSTFSVWSSAVVSVTRPAMDSKSRRWVEIMTVNTVQVQISTIKMWWGRGWRNQLGTPIIATCKRLRQEDCHEFGSNLDYTVAICCFAVSSCQIFTGWWSNKKLEELQKWVTPCTFPITALTAGPFPWTELSCAQPMT